jgi:zinc D-Ala-D-Ala carboxypeptidase
MKTRIAASFIAAVTAVTAGAVVATPAQAGTITGRCTHTNSEPTLRRGSSGTAVRQAQCELIYAMRGANIIVDGAFGPATDGAVRRFQGCARVAEDGIIGPTTWSLLNWYAARTPINC